jgi:hypothetical protein
MMTRLPASSCWLKPKRHEERSLRCSAGSWKLGAGSWQLGASSLAGYNQHMGLLWFRKSRKKDAKPEPAPPPAAPPRQARVDHLRLRGLLLLNLQSSDGIDQIETAPPLGERASVIDAVAAAVPGIAFGVDGKGELVGTDHRVAIDLGRNDVVHAAVAAVEGDSGIELLRTLLEQQGWRAYAPRAGVFIEPDALDLFALPDDSPRENRL